jgi:hypothetical protein
VTLGMRVGRAAFKKGSILRAVDMPLHSPHALRPSTFRAPEWGAPVSPSSCCCWRSATPRGLALFRHRSASRIFITQPGCSPSPMVIRRDDHQPCGGEKQVGLRPLPRPQLQGCSSSRLGRGAHRDGACLRAGSGPLLPSVIGGEGCSPPMALAALRRRRPPATRGKANCCCQDRVQLSVFRPGDGRRLHRGVAQHVVRREGGTRVLGRSRSRSCGEGGSEDLPVRFRAAAARWCGVGGQVAVIVGAKVVVAIGEVASAEAVASADETVSATCAPDLWLFGFNGWFSSPVRGRERGPFSSSVCPGTIAAAVLPPETEVVAALLVQRSPASHLEFVVPQALWCGGCSYPREWNRSPVCNGTLSMGVCSLWSLRPEHLGIWA